MPKVRTYKDMEVELIRHTPNPGAIVRHALNTTMKKADRFDPGGTVSSETLAFLLRANHGSILEHVSFTFLIKGVSRAFLAQITRHRMASYTSASQHYQDYRDYPMVVSRVNAEMQLELDAIAEVYTHFVDDLGMKPEEARMILPNAACVNLIWTINARSFANFVSQRGCKRNVEEMYIFTVKAANIVEAIWLEYARVLGPECYTLGQCLQGKMSCGKPYPRSQYAV